MKPAKILPFILQSRTSPYRVTSLTSQLYIRRHDRPTTEVDVSPATSIPINDIDAVDGERLPTGGNVVRVTSYHMQAPFPYMHKRL